MNDGAAPDPSLLRYLARVWRFAIRGAEPKVPADVPVWSLCVPYVLWDRVIRYDGRRFSDSYTKGIPAGLTRVVPFRFLYLVSLFAFPLVSALRALGRGFGARRYFRSAIARPDVLMFFPTADLTDDEVRHSRPDQPLAMLHAHAAATSMPDHLRLDDKRHFLETLGNAGFPVPPAVTLEAALAGTEAVIAKDPDSDLGFGVYLLTPDELREWPGRETLLLQKRLVNHPVLRAVYPPNAPLSSFRVITTLDPDTRQPYVSRCAIRMGMDGSEVDNTAQGGIWAGVHPKTGIVGRGIRKKTFAVTKRGRRVAETVHPDSGKRFEGLKIPWFDECRRLALDAHRRLAPDAPSLGWDLALSETPPVFLEVNVWAACYDYDCPDDAFLPDARLVVALRNPT